MNLAFFDRLGPLEVVVIILAILLLFGAKRIPELARSLGKSISEFKKGQQEGAQPDAPKGPEGDKKDP